MFVFNQFELNLNFVIADIRRFFLIFRSLCHHSYNKIVVKQMEIKLLRFLLVITLTLVKKELPHTESLNVRTVV